MLLLCRLCISVCLGCMLGSATAQTIETDCCRFQLKRKNTRSATICWTVQTNTTSFSVFCVACSKWQCSGLSIDCIRLMVCLAYIIILVSGSQPFLLKTLSSTISHYSMVYILILCVYFLAFTKKHSTPSLSGPQSPG